jgi:alpha-tubulin suppressor-like RCC1 family protein
LGDNSDRIYTVEADGLNSKISDICTGESHSFVLRNGQVYAFGRNDEGEYGTGDTTRKNIMFPSMTNVKGISQIACGWYTSTILVNEYSCYGKSFSNSDICSGNGVCVGTDICSCTNGFSGKECQFSTCFGINSTNTNVCSGNGNCTNPNICQCKSGYDGKNCAFELNVVNTVYTFGGNAFGQLGDGTTTISPIPIKISSSGITNVDGNYYTRFLTNNGTKIFGFGLNDVRITQLKISFIKWVMGQISIKKVQFQSQKMTFLKFHLEFIIPLY